MGVNSIWSGASGLVRFSIVIQKTHQRSRQKIAMKLTSRSALRNFPSSALQPDFNILWKISIFQRSADDFNFSTASVPDLNG